MIGDHADKSRGSETFALGERGHLAGCDLDRDNRVRTDLSNRLEHLRAAKPKSPLGRGPRVPVRNPRLKQPPPRSWKITHHQPVGRGIKRIEPPTTTLECINNHNLRAGRQMF